MHICYHDRMTWFATVLTDNGVTATVCMQDEEGNLYIAKGMELVTAETIRAQIVRFSGIPAERVTFVSDTYNRRTRMTTFTFMTFPF